MAASHSGVRPNEAADSRRQLVRARRDDVAVLRGLLRPRFVEYPTPAAFLEMVTTEEYAKVHEHRAAALHRGDLIATSTWMAAEQFS